MNPSLYVAVATTVAMALALPTGAAQAGDRLALGAPWISSGGPTSTVVFTGVDFSNDAYAVYAGTIVALNRDLSKEGFRFRAVGVHAGYEYGTDLGLGPVNIDGDAWLFDLMIGYQFFHPGHRFGIYIGGEYQDHDLSPNDPFNSVSGSEGGFKVAVDFETDESQKLYAGVLATYSTAYDTYWSRARLGVRLDRFVVGIEGGASGNEEYDSQRLGAFLNIPLGIHYGQLSLNGGYQFADEDGALGGGGEGGYGGVGVSFAF